MSAECPGCGGPVDAIPGYESRTTYCSRACQVRANRRRNRKGVAAELDRLRAERDALRSIVRRAETYTTLLPGQGGAPLSEWARWTPAEADAIRHAIETDR